MERLSRRHVEVPDDFVDPDAPSDVAALAVLGSNLIGPVLLNTLRRIETGKGRGVSEQFGF